MNSIQQELINNTLPLKINAPAEDVDPIDWVITNKAFFEKNLLQYGAILLRNFKNSSVEEFENFITKTSGSLLAYRNRSTPRTALSGKIYSSTEYPSDQTIPQHNENAYTHEWPSRLFFCCIKASESGGQTPISDSRRVLKKIPAEIVEKFERYGVMYVRTFTPGLGLTWQETFQITDRIQMQKYCQKNNIAVDWLSDGRMRMKQVLQATTTHPISSERVWFNQAHLFHASALDPQIRATLEKDVSPDEMPRNSFLGNGEAIDQESLMHIRQAYDEEESLFFWEEGDILILDNILVAHGRKPYQGERKIIVGMT